ncbi:MAG: ATP-binding cassette domain-containing protein [Pseudomarimonas sp.]
MSLVLQVTDLHVAYADHTVLQGVNLHLVGGELAGLIGPNGSGKSTLIRAIAGSQPMTRGEVWIGGENLRDAPLQARARLGFAIEPERLPRLLTGRQCIELLHELRGEQASIDSSWSVAEQLRLTPWLSKAVYTYSLGTRQKLAIVQALIGAPSLIVLDEVLNGLDPLAAFALKHELRARVDAGAAVLLATHGLDVAERLLDRALLLLDGRIAEDWDASALATFRADPEGGLEHAVAMRLRER